MSSRRIQNLADVMDTGEELEVNEGSDEHIDSHQVPQFSEILKSSEDFSIAHQLLATSILNKGIVTKKGFYLNFIRSVVTVNLKRHPDVIPKISCTKEDLDGLVTSLFERLNPRLAELGFRLVSTTEEDTGRELIALVTEDVLPKEISSISGFTTGELALFARYVRQMVEGGGECEHSWALQEGSKLPNPMSLMKSQVFLDKLVRTGWISERHCSEMSSASSSYGSQRNIPEIKGPQVQTASDICWNRLRTVVFAIRSTRENLENHKRQLETGGDLNHLVVAHDIAQQIQSLEITIARQQKMVEHLKRMCTKKRIILMKTNEHVIEKNNQLDLQSGLAHLQAKCDYGVSVLDVRSKSLNVFMQIASVRRRVLLEDVANILRIAVQAANVSKEEQDCSCSTKDAICSLHLPPLMELLSPRGHQAIEVASALGHIVHFLMSVSQLLDYTFRYPVHSCASSSTIYCPTKHKSFPLYWTRWRSGRENFEQAVSLLGKDIAQIQKDSDFSLFPLEYVLLSIYAWMKCA
ncbi:hypothetical protein ANCCAN_24466 [Ancylostoma caninum]|uniref:Uncharacterized protein n=1 Tax=Ancylostoma caninum TaxID=29170 RepID=A0A368FC77_ANCCA|nr:hypothetical protein ANCCAN_24466 [Ancylostoma caninum]